MSKPGLNWKPDFSLPNGKGATKQRFAADDGSQHLTIETTPWGEGDLAADGSQVAHVDGEKSGPAAFRRLDRITEQYEEGRDAFSRLECDK